MNKALFLVLMLVSSYGFSADLKIENMSSSENEVLSNFSIDGKTAAVGNNVAVYDLKLIYRSSSKSGLQRSSLMINFGLQNDAIIFNNLCNKFVPDSAFTSVVANSFSSDLPVKLIVQSDLQTVKPEVQSPFSARIVSSITCLKR